MKLSMCRSISFKLLFVKDGTTNGWVFAESCLYPTRVRTEKLWQVFKHSFVAPAVNNGKLPPGSSVKKKCAREFENGNEVWFQTKSDTSLWRMPAKFGCQTHFSGFNKTFLILKKEQTFQSGMRRREGFTKYLLQTSMSVFFRTETFSTGFFQQ